MHFFIIHYFCCSPNSAQTCNSGWPRTLSPPAGIAGVSCLVWMSICNSYFFLNPFTSSHLPSLLTEFTVFAILYTCYETVFSFVLTNTNCTKYWVYYEIYHSCICLGRALICAPFVLPSTLQAFLHAHFFDTFMNARARLGKCFILVYE